MRIILDKKFLSKKHLPGYYQFLFDSIVEMARRYPSDSFIFLTHERGKTLSNVPANVSVQYVKKAPLIWMSEKWWYRNSLPKRLKELQPALFVAVDNLYVTSKGMPTCIFMIQLNAVLELVPGNKASSPAQEILRGFLKQLPGLITFSKRSKQMIQKQTSLPKEKIKLLKPALSSTLRELMWTERESLKVKYAAGCEYFVFAGEFDAGHNLIGLLKAFSRFKKMQQSNLQLVLAAQKTTWLTEFKEKLSTFKYRDDVHIITNPSSEELDTIISGAYALVYPAQFDTFPVNILRAMTAGVPVIASKLPTIEEMAGPAAIYPDANDEEGFSKSMQDIYKDENLRTSIIQTAKSRLLTTAKYDMLTDCRNFFEAVFTSK